MFSGFYTAASGMMIQQRKINVLTNNIANSKTPGFRAERVVTETFDHELLTRMERGNTAVVGSGSPIRIVRDVPVNFDSSSLAETGRPFDMAIEGHGFFNVLKAAVEDENGAETAPEQTLLTRNGNFELDGEGYLVLPGIGRVLGQKGEIKLGSAYFSVSKEGVITDARGRRVDTLLVTEPIQGAALEKTGTGLYTVEDLENNTRRAKANVLQGVIENPNIDINREYSLVMEAQRAFQACSSAIKIVDAMNQKAASQIAAI